MYVTLRERNLYMILIQGIIYEFLDLSGIGCLLRDKHELLEGDIH